MSRLERPDTVGFSVLGENERVGIVVRQNVYENRSTVKMVKISISRVLRSDNSEN